MLMETKKLLGTDLQLYLKEEKKWKQAAVREYNAVHFAFSKKF